MLFAYRESQLDSITLLYFANYHPFQLSLNHQIQKQLTIKYVLGTQEKSLNNFSTNSTATESVTISKHNLSTSKSESHPFDKHDSPTTLSHAGLFSVLRALRKTSLTLAPGCAVRN